MFWGQNQLTIEMHFRKNLSENITCGICEYVASDVETLDTHTIICEIFKCLSMTCKNKVFKHISGIKEHIKKKHSEENNNIEHLK